MHSLATAPSLSHVFMVLDATGLLRMDGLWPEQTTKIDLLLLSACTSESGKCHPAAAE